MSDSSETVGGDPDTGAGVIRSRVIHD